MVLQPARPWQGSDSFQQRERKRGWRVLAEGGVSGGQVGVRGFLSLLLSVSQGKPQWQAKEGRGGRQWPLGCVCTCVLTCLAGKGGLPLFSGNNLWSQRACWEMMFVSNLVDKCRIDITVGS